MKTADETPVDSTRKTLPEMPYMSVARPAAYTGPKASTATKASDTTPGDFRFEMGAGRVQSGWLTLAADSARGYGTTGQSKVPVSFLNPVQPTVVAECKKIYLGVIAYPIADQTNG